MGGMDRMDQDINQYRIGIRGKKWYWSILTWLLDAAINKKTGRKMTKLEFWREIAMTYLTRYKTPVKSVGPMTHSSKRTPRVLDDIQYNRKNHLLSEVENKEKMCK